MSQLSKIVILTTSGGEGLISGSIAIKEAIEEISPDTQVDIIDFFGNSGSILGALLTSIYNFLLRRSLRINAMYVRLIHRLRVDTWRILSGTSVRNLKGINDMYEPDLIIITSQYIVASVCFAREKLSIHTPLVVANIDPGLSSVPLWFDPRVDLHLIPSAEAMSAYQKRGLPLGRAVRVKLMVKKKFTRINFRSREDLRTEIGFDPNRPLLLFTGSREGYAGMKQLLLRTLNETHSQIAVICGANKKLFDKLTAATEKYGDRVQVFGWCEDNERLMKAADLIISKPGKQTMKESLAVGTPLLALAYPAVMEQEIGNLELLRNHNALLEARSEDDAMRSIANVLSDKSLLAKLQRAASDCGKDLICRETVPQAIFRRFNAQRATRFRISHEQTHATYRYENA